MRSSDVISISEQHLVTVNPARRSASLQQHINQLPLTETHCTQALQVISLGAKAEHGDLPLRADQRQGTYRALGMLAGIEVVGDLAQGLGGITPVLPLELQNVDGHSVTIWWACACAWPWSKLTIRPWGNPAVLAASTASAMALSRALTAALMSGLIGSTCLSRVTLLTVLPRTGMRDQLALPSQTGSGGCRTAPWWRSCGGIRNQSCR